MQIANATNSRCQDRGGGAMNDRNPAVINAIEKMKKKLRPQKYYFYGDECSDMACKPIAQFPGITNLLELFAVLEQCWAKDTAYPSCQEEWVANDPSYGQCAITATLVYDMFGGSTLLQLPDLVRSSLEYYIGQTVLW